MNNIISSFEIIFFIGIIVSNLLIGIFVLWNNSRAKLNRAFFAFIVGISSWIIFAFISELYSEVAMKLLFTRLAFMGAFFAIVFLLMFSYFFPKETKRDKLFNTLIVIGTLLVNILIFFSSTIIKGIILKPWGFDIDYDERNFYLLMLFGVIILFKTFKNFLTSYFSADKSNRLKFQYFILGIAIYMGVLLFFQVGVRSVTGTDEYYRFGNYAIIIFTGFTAYAIAKHRLMDIRFLVVRSITYFALLIIFAFIYVFTIFVFGGLIFGQFTGKEAYWASMIVALLVGFTFYPLKAVFTKWTDKVFFKDRYNFEELTSQLNETATSTIILPELLFKFLNLLVDEMRVTRGAFVLLEKGKIYESQTLGYKQVLSLEKSDVDHLSKERKIEVFDEAEEGSECKEIMRRHDAVVILPLIAENELIGLLFLGEKKSGDAYSQKDIDVLRIVSNQLALGIQNAKAYEQVQKFNFTLRAEINRATKEVKDANVKLVDLDKSKDEFISLASHEIRTPIATLEGYLSILVNQKLKPDDRKDILNRAYDSVGRLAILAKDLLDTSRIDQERLVINKELTRLEVLIERVVEGFEFRAKEKGIFVKYKKADRLLPEVNIDPERISEVFNNIIGNAIKFTHKGGITVSAQLKDKTNVLISISDTGEGIPKDDIPNLFKKFYQAQTASSILSKDKGGTGLGLYITKNIVDIHGGKIWIESRLRRGTTFFVSLPIK